MENWNLAIESELARRIQRNPRYSLRSFAKSLGISHTLLSLVLSGKRPISKKLREKLEDYFGVIPEIPEAAAPSEYHQISLDTFAILSDWQHYAILNLMETPQAKFEERWISQRLGITRAEAGIAILRLKRLGLMKLANGKWKRNSAPLKVENNISTADTRRYQHQVLEKAAESLENDPFEARDFSSMVLAMDPKQIPYARKKIQEFRRSLTKDLEARGPRSEVYHLAVQIYPVSKKREKK
jgi:uncharacterized protein (TIGR02147 family)